MGAKHGRGRLAEAEERAGATRDGQKGANRARSRRVRVRCNDDCVFPVHDSARVRCLDKIHDEPHRPGGQSAAVADALSLRRGETAVLRADVRRSERLHSPRHHVLHRHRQFPGSAGISHLRPVRDPQGSHRALGHVRRFSRHAEEQRDRPHAAAQVSVLQVRASTRNFLTSIETHTRKYLIYIYLYN